MSTITEEKVDSKVEEILSKPYRLDLHNDDYNSFDHVISCLMKVCGHEYEQANQCAHLVHFKGVCDIKYGDLETISEMKDKLVNAGLSVTMEVNQ
jgi:ATP-dependent Clp protease adaptor protein ClpS